MTGTTAGDTENNYVKELSTARANAVKRTLVDLGVSESRIKAIGLGNADPWHIEGVGTTGPLAAQNRKVVIIDADSPLGRDLIEKQ